MLNIREKITETTWVEVKERANAGEIGSGVAFGFSLCGDAEGRL